jgi:multisubunit Na+/H+ antiporter MnhE subunit
MDALFLAAFFASVFIFTLILSAIVDWALFQLLGVRLYPRRFFKSDKEVWKQW